MWIQDAKEAATKIIDGLATVVLEEATKAGLSPKFVRSGSIALFTQTLGTELLPTFIFDFQLEIDAVEIIRAFCNKEEKTPGVSLLDLDFSGDFLGNEENLYTLTGVGVTFGIKSLIKSRVTTSLGVSGPLGIAVGLGVGFLVGQVLNEFNVGGQVKQFVSDFSQHEGIFAASVTTENVDAATEEVNPTYKKKKPKETETPDNIYTNAVSLFGGFSGLF